MGVQQVEGVGGKREGVRKEPTGAAVRVVRRGIVGAVTQARQHVVFVFARLLDGVDGGRRCVEARHGEPRVREQNLDEVVDRRPALGVKVPAGEQLLPPERIIINVRLNVCVGA